MFYTVIRRNLVAKQMKKKKQSPPLSAEELAAGGQLGLDSHADMSCAGRHARIIEVVHGSLCNVKPFHDSYKSMEDIQTVNVSFAHDTKDGRTFILNMNQCLDFTDGMENSLLCPNQARDNGVIVNDIPKFLDPSGKSTHSIYFPMEDINLPLDMNGPISYLPVRYPSDNDLDHCQQLDLTSAINWDPSSFDGLNRGVASSSVIFNDFDVYINQELNVNAISHRKTTSDVGAEELARLWKIPIEYAKRTLNATSQDSIRIAEGKIHRRVRTKAHQRRYKQLGGYLSMFASDTFKASVKSTRGNLYCQHFCNRGNFNISYPIKEKSHAHHALDRFIHEVGVPTEMLTDGASELIQSEWGTICKRFNIYQVTTEPYSPWQNPSELSGGINKRKVRDLMKSTNTPIRLWDYCWEYTSAIRSLTAARHIHLDDVTPFEKVHGYTPNISEYLIYSWFDWVWYHNPTSPDRVELGRWLGPAHSCGQGLAYYILTDSGKVKTRSTVHKLSATDNSCLNVEERKKLFTKQMEAVIGNFAQATVDNASENINEDPYDNLFQDDELDDDYIEFQELDDNGEPVGVPDFEPSIPNDHILEEQNDEFIGNKVPLPVNGELKEGIIKSRKRTADGSLVGTKNDNPICDSRIYEVEFPDGNYKEYAANVIIENLYAHVDDDGKSHAMLIGIIDHQSDDSAITKDEGSFITPHGTRRKRITTKGWRLKVEWDDGTSSWVPLKDLKESNPLYVAEYANSHGLISEPAFAWWCPHVLRKRDRVIKQVQHRLAKKNLKFGVRVPNTIEEALKFDKENGNNLWAQSIEKEMKNVRIAFELLEEGEKAPPGSKFIPHHLVFDVKFDLTRKSRMVAGGHVNKDIKSHTTFSSVVSRDSVRLALMLASLNELSVLSADIGNAYLNAPNRERVHTVCTPILFGPENTGRIAVITRALYGLKSAGAAWRYHFSDFIEQELGYKSTIADPDVYRKPMLKLDGTKYYSYLVVYVDDVLCISENPKRIMDQIHEGFRLKDGIAPPKIYLGTDVREMDIDPSHATTNEKCWSLGSENYMKEAIKVASRHMEKHDIKPTLTRRTGRNTPFDNHLYRPELDESPYCSDELATVYQNLIGILRWTCELGRLDILHEVSLLSQYLAQPRCGHLVQAMNIFVYLKHHNRSWMLLDHSRFDIEWVPKGNNDINPIERAQGLKDIYTDACDELPHNMPEARGKEVDITVFVDADHAGNRVTRRSHTGIIIYVNMAPIIWYSKRQNTVESSTFGSEFIALRIATDLVEALRYKLRMFGVPLSGPARVLCDNESVVKSSMYVESTLKKKHCSIAYHRVREAVAAGKILIYYESTSSNLADLLTKPLPHHKRRDLIQAILT